MISERQFKPLGFLATAVILSSAGPALAVTNPRPRPAGGQSRQILYVVRPDSEIDYLVRHPLHTAEGISHALTGQLAIAGLPDDPQVILPVTLQVPVSSFLSGNGNRDANMQEILDAADDPLVSLTLEAFRWGDRPPPGLPADATVRFSGVASAILNLHGVARPVTLPIYGTLSRSGLTATSRFVFKCSDYGISRPALLFMPISNRVEMTVKLDARANSGD